MSLYDDEYRLIDLACEELHNDGDVGLQLDAWVREHVTDAELLQRLAFLKEQAFHRAERRLECEAEDAKADAGDDLRKEALEYGSSPEEA